jgi:hypothetical protein
MAYFEPRPVSIVGWTTVVAFLGGAVFGYALHEPQTAATERLGKTDGVICMAESDTGPHWLIRPDGWCYAEDNPARK